MSTITLWVRKDKRPAEIRTKPPGRRYRRRWEAREFRWVECLDDFAGNSTQAGYGADLWVDLKSGQNVLCFSGGWDFYQPRTRPPTRINGFYYELSKLVTRKRAKAHDWEFNFDKLRGAIKLPEKAILLTNWRRSHEWIRKMFSIPDHVPVLGNYDGVYRWDRGLTTELRTLLEGRYRNYGEKQMSFLSFQAFETTDGRLRVTRAELGLKGVFDRLYVLTKDNKTWFVTLSYALVIRAFEQHARRNKLPKETDAKNQS